MPDVIVYRCDQPGAPVLSGLDGTMCSLLNACLVTGYGTSAVASLTRSGGVATLLFSSLHGFQIGDTIEVSGATQTEYNLTVNATAVTGNTVSFPVVGTPTTPATGTISARIAPAGWTRPYSGGTVSVFKSGAVTSSQRFLHLDDSYTDTQGYKFANASLYESMSDISTGVIKATKNWRKCRAAAVSTKWVLIASDRTFYLLMGINGLAGPNTTVSEPARSLLNSPVFFGDFTSFVPTDSFNCIVSSSDDRYLITSEGNVTSHVSSAICRGYTLLGSAVDLSVRAYELLSDNLVNKGVNPADQSVFFMSPRLLTEGIDLLTNVIRGTLPGSVQSLTSYAGTTLMTAAPTLSGRWERFDNVMLNGTPRSVMLFASGELSSGKGYAIDITGPW